MVATAASSRPRFRTDLVAEPIDEDGQRFIDVIDPDTGNAFRFYEVEYSIACAMDGERDVGGLADWAREELGITPSPDEIATVVATLGDLGYLEGAGAVSAPMFGDELVRPGVVAPPPAPVRGGDVELGAPGALTRGWDAPATSAAHEAVRADDVELGRAGMRASASAGPALESMDVGLGAAGMSARGGDGGEVIEFEAPTPPPADIGEPVSPSLRRTTSADDDEGPTHLPQPQAAGDFDDDEVSVDLSEHLAIRPDDVKEAVRASQVMKAVDVPPELLAQLDDREQKIAHAAEAAKAAAREAQAASAPQRNTPVVPMQAQPEPVPVLPSIAKPPVELPREPVAVGKAKPTKVAADAKAAADAAAKAADAAAKTPIAPVAEKRGTSGVLIALLIIVILGAGAFAVWKYVLDKDKGTSGGDDTSTETGSAGTGSASAGSAGSAVASGAGPATGSAGSAGSAVASGSASSGTASGSARPEPIGGTLHAAAAATVDLKAPQAGTISVGEAPGTQVNAGDVVVRLTASPRTEAKVAEIDYDLQKRYPAEIKRNTELAEAARKAGNEALAKQLDAKIAERQQRIAQRTQERAKYADELAKLEIKASAAGTVKKSSPRGTPVAANDVVATIEQGGGLTADLTVPGATYKAGDTVKVASKKAPDQVVDCTVAAVAGDKVTVSCAADSGWADGTDIVLAK